MPLADLSSYWCKISACFSSAGGNCLECVVNINLYVCQHGFLSLHVLPGLRSLFPKSLLCFMEFLFSVTAQATFIFLLQVKCVCAAVQAGKIKSLCVDSKHLEMAVTHMLILAYAHAHKSDKGQTPSRAKDVKERHTCTSHSMSSSSVTLHGNPY